MRQSTLFGIDPALSNQNLLPKDGAAYYHPELLTAFDSDTLMSQLQKSLQWEVDRLIMYGKIISTRRKVAWVGDPNCTYTYCGLKKIPQSWTPELLEIKYRAEELTQSEFNSCLLNLYHDGIDGMSWHSDNEPELDAYSPIVSLSLGATRKFAFRHKQDNLKNTLLLESGSALIMHAPTQQHWQHALLKSRAILAPRINLTFRKIKLLNK